MEPRTFTEKDLSPDGPGGCIWEGEEEMDCAFLFMFFNVCLYIGGEGEPFGVSGSQVCGKDVYGRKCHSGPQLCRPGTGHSWELKVGLCSF